MKFFDLVNISETYLEIVNPTNTDKLLAAGTVLGLNEEMRVIDYGCGYGETLALWGEYNEITGVGIDIREHACERARQKMGERGFGNNIRIVCANGAEYPTNREKFDVAVCLGSTFIWKGFRPALKGMKEAVHENGKLVVGELYWRNSRVPPEYAQSEKVHTEMELLKIIREEGYDLEYMLRSTEDEWDNYQSTNWFGLIQWMEENPDHADFKEVAGFLRKIQDDYFRYGREYLGWAIFILNPARY